MTDLQRMHNLSLICAAGMIVRLVCVALINVVVIITTRRRMVPFLS